MICTFRTANKQAFKAAFVSVLQLAQHLRLSKVGTVSVDGTKLQANASKHAAVSYARAGEMIAKLELEVQELVGRATACVTNPFSMFHALLRTSATAAISAYSTSA
jgi:hypothetical protein